MGTQKALGTTVIKPVSDIAINNESDTCLDTSTVESVQHISRRRMLRDASLASIAFALPWSGFGFPAQPKPLLKPPFIPFRKIEGKEDVNGKGVKGEGIIGPYGEVRIFSVGDEVLPAYISATNGLAELNCTGRSPFVRYGTGPAAIMLS